MSELERYRKDWTKLIKRFDSSFFYYDLNALQEHLSELDKNLAPDVKLWYACKANPLSAILKIFRNLNFGIDVASQGELDQALSSGVKTQDILSTGPSKSRKYLRSLLDNEVDVIVLESLNQAYWLDQQARELGVCPRVLLRVQLEFTGGQSVLGGDEITAFGLDPKAWRKLDKTRIKNLDIIGMHAFQWGNILDVSELKNIWWKTAQELKELAEELEVPLKVLDLGGGLGLPYEQGQKALNFDHINRLLVELKEEFGPEKIWMELGRYAVGDCGFYLTQVIDKKQVRGHDILILDGGINHIARPALTEQSFPCQVFRPSGKEFDSKTTHFHVHGPLCTALDKLGSFDLPSDVDEGDWLVFSKTGAYGFTEAMPFFLCHKLPAEVIRFKGDLVTPRVAKNSNDWLV